MQSNLDDWPFRLSNDIEKGSRYLRANGAQRRKDSSEQSGALLLSGVDGGKESSQ